MVVSRSCIQMVLSQVWSKLVCSNGKWIRKSGLTQPLMWLKRKSGGNWNVQALQPCMFLLSCLYPQTRVVWHVPKRWFRHQVWHVPKQNGSGTYSYKDFFWLLSGLGEPLKPDNIVYIMKGSPWKTWPIHILVDQSGIDGPSQIKKGRLFEIIRP